ncbi:MAG: FKBP-type peptidyl-prolyl cis-trans isomerase FkpA [Cyclobacteriaceae bacterium]|jgi:FKBP-type peptidyl-prolyl cis-trans isomerase FkpA
MKIKNVVFAIATVSVSMLSSCFGTDEFITFQEQLNADGAAIDKYLEENSIDAEVTVEGIRYVITREGSGEIPEFNSDVRVAYAGRFVGTTDVFDSNDNIVFNLQQVIAAWQIAVPLLKEGGEMTIYAPSGYCYGPQGTPGIAPNSNLEFDIKLIAVE